VEGDKKLFNPYGVIAVNPARVSGVNYEGAMKFIDFITSEDGQEIICYYGKMKYNKPLFVPMAIKSSACQEGATPGVNGDSAPRVNGGALDGAAAPPPLVN
jgi:ABC-type glycerol-3-phosphate transport system substrate-binding protein